MTTEKTGVASPTIEERRQQAEKLSANRLGERKPKLNWDRVDQIRQLSKEGHSNVVLGEMYNVRQQTIGSVVRNETWKEESRRSSTS